MNWPAILNEISQLTPFASPLYFGLLGLLGFARGMDFVSTRIASPKLLIEGNPIGRKLGWKGSVILNLLFCPLAALLPFCAILTSTTSILAAAHNFRSAWMSNTLGEEQYQLMMSETVRRANRRVFFWCLIGETGLTALVGIAVLTISFPALLPLSIGFGIVAYSMAVVLYTLIALRRIRD